MPRTGLGRSLVTLFEEAQGSVAGDPVEAAVDLDAEAGAFIRRQGARRSRAATRIEALATTLQSTQRYDPVADTVLRLAMGPAPEGERPSRIELARTILTPQVAERLAERLAVVLDSSRRSMLVRTLSRLGPTMARAVGEALGRARSRPARRALADLLVAIGEEGEVVLRRMVDDERGSVARDAAVILGEAGGLWAVKHLERALRHADPRVRREALLAIGRVDPPGTPGLVTELLGDPEADVREVAARIIGGYREAGAVEPLATIVGAGDSEAVIVAAMHALGRIGDPRALDVLAQRALAMQLSSPPVRAAAYQSIVGIGTARARKIARSGLRDPDAGVREIVRRSLEGGSLSAAGGSEHP